MRAFAITAQGDPVAPNAACIDMPDPSPSAGDVLVHTEASAFNHLDLWVGRGLPGVNTQYPHIGGSDGCGRVHAVGEDVDESWIGKRVVVNAAMEQPQTGPPAGRPAGRDIVMLGEHTHGTHAEAFCAPASNVLDVGDTDPVQAAAFGLAHLTAWRMLVTKGQLQRGDSVLATGIGGGVALATLGIAKHMGCEVVVTSRHQWKLDRARELGADHGVLDTGEDFSRAVRAATGKRGVDVCIDSIGGPLHKPCVKSLARGGRLALCGCTAGANPTTDLARLFWNQQSILGSTMGDMHEFADAMAMLIHGHVMPVIDTVYAADDGATALARLEAGEQFGKLVLDWR
jgi:NADPH:quinone reductase-like Zn-dependent oxidoreductase